ncbi:MAG: hypothetical protein A4E59_01367 [Syntrophorhabdus sp. PtaB.Bin027]|jgi:hypothetical protein|nr:MAG: hypothetical protein A4E59_01367 [Syntrophorhabdus sp. PtaB.Bin027]
MTEKGVRKMKKIMFAVIVAFILTLACQFTSYATDGNTLLESCTAAIQKMDGKDKVSGVKVGYCYGYVQGLIDMNAFYKVSGAPPLFCSPQTISNGEGARIIYNYLQNHRERLGEYAGILAVDAYVEAFPCSDLKLSLR